LDETEVFMPEDTLEGEAEPVDDEMIPTGRKSVIGYPSTWANNFGSNFYTHAQARELATFVEDGTWQLAEQTQPFSTTELKVTSHADAHAAAQMLIQDIRQDYQQEE